MTWLLRHWPDDPVTRLPTRELTKHDFDSGQVAKIARTMMKIMEQHGGVGLAANQIGMQIQLAVISREASGGKPYTVANPVLTDIGSEDEWEISREGCLSLPGAVLDVPRSPWIGIECMDANGEALEVDADGFEAIVLQHELDHLRGRVIVDSSLQRTEFMRYLRYQA